jgi:hypothetical protein
MNDDSNQSIAFTSMIILSRCVIVESRGREGREEKEKKKRGERGAFFFSLLAQIVKPLLFCLSKLTSACARDEFRRLVSTKVFIIIANKTRRNRAHLHSFSLELSLSFFLE